MLDFSKMSDDRLFFPQLFTEPPFNPRTTHCLRTGKPAAACQCEPLPPALDLPDLANDDWPAIDYAGAYDNSDEPDADANDGDLLLPFEE